LNSSEKANEWCEKLVEELKSNKKLLEIGLDEDSGSDSNPSEDNLPLNIVRRVLPRKKHKIVIERKSRAKKVINAISLSHKKFTIETKPIEGLSDRQLTPIKPRLIQKSESRSIISNKPLLQIIPVVKATSRAPKRTIPLKVKTIDASTQTTSENLNYSAKDTEET
jgi:hypothetical protein